MKYVIGIDGGTQSTKMGIYDLKGNLLIEVVKPLKPLYMPDAETAEHPGDDLFESFKAAAKELMGKFNGKSGEIVGIGLGSIRCCRVYLKADGSLSYPVINWMDQRLSKPYSGDVENTAYVTTTTGYLTHRLTGNFKDTISNYEGIYGPLDRKKWQWSKDPEDYKSYNVTRDMLFDLVFPGDLLGKITDKAAKETDLPVGCPVYATANDKAVEALGSGLHGENRILISLGTYIGGMVEGKEYLDDGTHYWTNPGAIPREYLYETARGIRRGMWSITWFKKLLGEELEKKAKEYGVKVEDLLEEEAVKVPAGSEGLMTVGEFLAPKDQPYRKAFFVGMDGRHGRGHLYRSIMESIAMTMKLSMDEMIKELKIEPTELIISGGGSNSRLFTQIFADVFGMKTLRMENNNAAGLGAAMNAAVGAGIYENYNEAKDNMVREKDRFRPDDKANQCYKRIMEEIYSEIKDHSDPINKKIYALFG